MDEERVLTGADCSGLVIFSRGTVLYEPFVLCVLLSLFLFENRDAHGVN
jgi:hypothetical protein